MEGRGGWPHIPPYHHPPSLHAAQPHMLLSHSPTATSSENHAPSAYHRKKNKKNGATHGGERQKRTHGGRIKGRQTMDREKTRIRRTEERGQVEGKQDLNRTWVAAERMKLVALGRQRRLRLLGEKTCSLHRVGESQRIMDQWLRHKARHVNSLLSNIAAFSTTHVLWFII